MALRWMSTNYRQAKKQDKISKYKRDTLSNNETARRWMIRDIMKRPRALRRRLSRRTKERRMKKEENRRN